MGQISAADPANFMPVYNWTEAFFFAAHPHAEITFTGSAITGGGAAIPEPGLFLLVTACVGSLALIIDARKSSLYRRLPLS
jgi:hypothetical protein